MSARRSTLALACAVAGALAAVAPRAARAQSLAARVAGAPDGQLSMTYATRADACGDGRDVVAVRDVLTAAGSMQMRGWTNVACVHGPARLALTVARGAVTDLRVHVGAARAAPADARDWGTVPAADAAELALGLAARLTGRAAQRAVVAATVADAPDTWRRLLALARNAGAADHTRRTAMHWLGAIAPAEAVAPITALVRDAGEPRMVREGALAVLAFAPDGAGVPALIGVTRGGVDGWLREKAIFWLGQADDGRARSALRALAAGDSVAPGAREQAIFALAHGQGDAEAGAFLRALYPRLTAARLRDKVIQSVAQTDDRESRRWLLALAADEGERVEARKQALFWAGQQDDAPLADLLALYPKLTGTTLRKHYTFVLSQRDEEAAVDALIAVARNDEDPAVRRQALFWLGQSRSPRAQRYLTEVIER
jgi:HEAT repeat protein